MQKMYLLIMLLGGAMVLRALYFVVLDIYFCKNSYCTVERIVNPQKACDKVQCVFSVFRALLWIWLLCVYAFGYFKVDISMLVFNTISMGVLGLTFIAYNTIKRFMMAKYELRYFYNSLVEYRSNLEVMTEDNDCEVNFIKSYDKVKRNTVTITLCMLGALALYMFLL